MVVAELLELVVEVVERLAVTRELAEHPRGGHRDRQQRRQQLQQQSTKS